MSAGSCVGLYFIFAVEIPLSSVLFSLRWAGRVTSLDAQIADDVA